MINGKPRRDFYFLYFAVPTTDRQDRPTAERPTKVFLTCHGEEYLSFCVQFSVSASDDVKTSHTASIVEHSNEGAKPNDDSTITQQKN